MEPKLNPQLKKFLSNPEIGIKVTSAILDNNNKIASIKIILEEFGQEIELIPIGYSGPPPNNDKK